MSRILIAALCLALVACAAPREFTPGQWGQIAQETGKRTGAK